MQKLLVIIALLFSISANAADIYDIDPNNTSVTWRANHFGFSTPSGKFTNISGSISINKFAPHKSSVDITIQTSAMTTGFAIFDNHLKSADFLNISKFPTAKFKSTKVTVKGRTGATITGDLTLLGKTKPVTVKVKLNKIGKNPVNQKDTIGFSGIAKFKRSDFGMNFGIPGISDEVKLRIEAEAILSQKEQEEEEKELPADYGKKFPTYDNPDNQWQIVDKESSIIFTATQAKSKINGSFSKFDGKIAFDKDAQKGNMILINVDTSSLDLSFKDGIETLKSASWLAVSSFRKATFKATKFKRLGDRKFIAQGNLTIKGKTIPTNAQFYLTTYNKNNATAKGSFTIKRSDFGVGDANVKKALNVEEEVKISFTLVTKKNSKF